MTSTITAFGSSVRTYRRFALAAAASLLTPIRSMSLTDEGRAYLERCKQILADIEDADLMVALTNNDQVNILACALDRLRRGREADPPRGGWLVTSGWDGAIRQWSLREIRRDPAAIADEIERPRHVRARFTVAAEMATG